MKIVFSPLNQLRFVSNETQIGARYNTNKYDNVVFYEQKLDWQERTCFLQPVQKQDKLALLFEVNGYLISGGGFQAKLELKNANREVVKSVNLNNTFDQDSFLEYFYVSPTNFYLDIPEGNYYFQLTIPYSGSGGNYYTHVFYSEPIALRDKHEGSLLLNYVNSFNQFSVPFETTSSILLAIKNNLEFRVYGALINMNPSSDRVVFVDQNSNAVSLKTNVYRTWDLAIGGDDKAVPDWVLEKINHIMACDVITIDGVRYSPNEGASIEKSGNITYNKYYATISLRQYDYPSAFNQENPSSIQIIEFPSHEHVYFYKIALKDANGIEKFNMNGHYITINSTQRGLLVTKLNSELLAQGVEGSFAISGNILYYNSPVTSGIVSAETRVLTTLIAVDVSVASLSPLNFAGFSFQLGLYNSACYFSNHYLISANNPTANPVLVTSGQYIMPPTLTTGEYRTLIFFDGQITGISEFVGNCLKQIDLRLSGLSTYFDSFDGHDVSNNFVMNPSLLGNHAKNVTSLYIDSSTDWKNFGTFNNLSYGELPYSNLRVITLIESALTSTEADAILNDLYDYAMAFKLLYGYDPFPQTIIIDFRYNLGATPTVASALAQNYIINILNGQILS